MKILSRFLAFAAAVLFVGSSALADGSVDYQGQTISWTGLNATSSLKSDGSVCVIKFTSGSGNVTLPGKVRAEVLAIGGGGGGAGGASNLGSNGGGGHGGGGESNPAGTEWLKAGTYAVSVGAGGSAGGKSEAGGDGSPSTFSGNGVTITGPGGAKGTVNGEGGGASTFKSNIEDPTGGTWKEYGVGGAAGQSSPSGGAANTGNGGDGGVKGLSRKAGAAGGSGVVIMRISSIKTSVQLETLMVYRPWTAVTKTIQDYTDSGTPTCSSSDPSVATVSASISGDHLSIQVTPIKSGDTTITVDTDTHAYELPVVVWDAVTYKGQTVYFKNGSATTVGEDVVLTYTSGTGGVILPTAMKADYLVVGGGGGGGRGTTIAIPYSAGSGGGGAVNYKTGQKLVAGTYVTTVGAGGTCPTTNEQNGTAGSGSSLVGNGVNATAAGGAGGKGGTSKSSGANGANAGNYSITGSGVDYGYGGAYPDSDNRGTPGAANTGTGGISPAGIGDTNHGNGYGGSGIVVLRLTGVPTTETRSSTAALTTADASKSVTLSSAFSGAVQWTGAVTSGNSGVATATMQSGSTATATPTMVITPKGVGTTTLTVMNSSDTDYYTFTWTVTVTVKSAESKTSSFELSVQAGAKDFQLEAGKAFTQSLQWNSTVTSGNGDVATAVMVNGTTATQRPTMRITPKSTGTTTLTVVNSSGIDGYAYTWTVNVKVYGEVGFKGQTIRYDGSGVTCSGGGDQPVVLTFTSTADSGDFIIPSGLEALVDYLVIGGGGSGGSGQNYNSTSYPRYGGGGSGGRGEEGFLVPFPANTYTVEVGAGGAAVQGTTSAAAPGNDGRPSSISASGFSPITGAGGAGGTTGTAAPDNQTDGNITSSSISGSPKTYAQKGTSSGNTQSTGTAGAPGTGNGGNGGGRGGASGAGGSGAVVVKIRDVGDPRTPVDGGTLILGVGDELTLRDGSFASAWVAVSSDPSIATVVDAGAAATAPVITGEKIGTTTVHVYNETEAWTYTVSVVENLTDVYLCVGDTVQFGFRSDAATATWATTLNGEDFTSTDAKAGAYTTVARSTSAASQAFNVLVTATAASGELTDMLYVKGSGAQDPVYAYRIHVAPARELSIGETATVECNTSSSRSWTAQSEQLAIARVTPTSAAAANSFEAVISAVRNGETTVTAANATIAMVNNQEVGATYTFKVKVDGTVPVNVSLARGSSVKWTDVCSKGSATYTLDKTLENGVSAVTEKTGDTTAVTTLAAAPDAPVGATATFTVLAANGDEVTVYNVTVTDVMRIPDSAMIPMIASSARERWGYETSDESVANPDATGSPLAGTANVSLTPGHPGDATLSATNDWAEGTQAYGWNVRVYSVHTTSLTLNVNSQDDVTMRNYGDLQGSWSAQIDNPDAATMSFDIESRDGDPVNAAMLTIGSAKTLGLDVDELVSSITASNVYHEESILLTVKKQVRDQGSRTVVAGNSVVIDGAATDAAWKAVVSPEGIATLSSDSGAAGDTLTVTSLPEKGGTVEVKVRNATTVFTYTVRVVPQPHVVKFCEGDSVRIWYHNTEPKNWFLLVNDEVVQGNLERAGREMRAKVTMEGSPNKDAYLDAWAVTPGAESDGDMIVVSDGENYYAYLMSVAEERVIGVGESTNMVCSTVATNFWRSSVPTEYRPFVEVRNDPDDQRVHSTTATITGVAATDVAYVEVSDELFDASEVNAQGAIYRLKVRVEGTPTISVHLTPSAYLEAPQDYRYGTETTQFRIFLDGAPVEGASATKNGLTFTMTQVSGTSLVARFDAAPDAASDAQARFEVRDGEDTVAVYNVDIAGPVRAITVGTVINGVLNPAPVEWIAESSDPSVASVKSVQYGELWSVEATAKKPGDFYCESRNPMISEGYWGSLTYVYDMHTTETNLAPNTVYEFDVANVGALAGVWTAAASSDLVSVELSDGANALNSVHVKITTGGSVGATTVKVSNLYHAETFNIYVGGTAKPVFRFATPITVVCGRTASLPGECSVQAWTAGTENAAIVSLPSASGEAGVPVTVRGGVIGSALVTVEDADAVRIYTVETVPDSGELETITIRVGEDYTYTVPEGVTVNSVYSGDRMTATATKLDDRSYVLTGLQDGTVTLTVMSPGVNYTQKVIVHKYDIDKQLKLVIGKTTTSTYTYTFDQIRWITNSNPDRVSIEQRGNTLTLTPLAITSGAKVDVGCVVDNLTEPSVLHYTIEIVKLDDPDLEIWQRPGDDGYIGYKSTAEIFNDDETGDVVMIFTNTASQGAVYVPDAYTAKMDFLAVGGGGGGGTPATPGYGGGGGGAGGFSLVTNKYMMAGSFGVAVGAGGLGTAGALGMPTPGFVGGPSAVTNAFGYIVVSANGGGGGGVPTASGTTGGSGASGGGGAWYNNLAGQGGRGIDGQGTNGGCPSEAWSCGGGGGGAGGKGGNDKSYGIGLSSDLSGEDVYYAQGGLGGDSVSTAAAADGSGPGFGGDGGNCGGEGGNGADGVVVVRMKDIYKNVKVPVPTTNDLIVARFQWDNPTNCVPFDYYGKTFRSPSDSHPYLWDDAIDYVKGSTNVVCYLQDETNKVGVGYYSFTVYLKDGFSWDTGEADDAYGSTSGRRYLWAVVEDLANIDASLSITKSVVWQDSSNATIEVTAASSPEISGGGTPNVLFLGTLCDGHGMDINAVNKALKAAVKVANVEYHLLGVSTSATVVNHTGSLEAGDVDGVDRIGLTTSDFDAPRHYALSQFYDILYDKLVSQNKTYDYIVFEFDGSRLADSYSVNSHEAAVAAVMKGYYESESVIWVVDNCDAEANEPWQSDYWRPNTYYNNGQDRNMAIANYRGLVGMFDPSNYVANTTSWTDLKTVSKVVGRNTYYAAPERYPVQSNYANADNLAKFIAETIKVKPFNLKYVDKIVNPASGLTITGVGVVGCTNEVNGVASADPADWFDIIEWDAKTGETTVGKNLPFPGASIKVDLSTNLVSVVLSNVAITVWTKFDTHVVDDGTFRSSEGATFNQRTGKWEKNPNDGPVNISMVNNLGEGVGVEGEAETDVPWVYTAYPIHGTVLHGNIYIAGTAVNPISMGEGENVTVYYVGWGGYKLDKVIKDNDSLPMTEEYACSYTFENLREGHEIVVEYVPFYSGVDSFPATYEYDGQAHVFDVQLWDDWDPEFETQIRYSLNASAGSDEFMTEEDFIAYCTSNKLDVVNAGEHTIYYHVFAYQLGYGETITDWGWVDTQIGGCDTVTITKRPLGITPNSIFIPGADAPENAEELKARQDLYKGVTAVGLIEGDTLRTEAIVFDCPSYQKAVGQYKSFPSLDETRMSMEEFVGPNYEVSFNSGVVNVIRSAMQIGKVAQSAWLDPEDRTQDTGVKRVEKQYDGLPTNLTVRVDLPLSPSAYRIKYSIDDRQTWGAENPTFVDVGTNRVWYAVDGTDAGYEGESLYFSVTNYNYVIITPAPLTIKTPGAEKRYDGTALTADGYEVTAGQIAARDTVESVTVTGAQTEVGSSANGVGEVVITWTDEEGTAYPSTQNYDIRYDEGTLTVTRAVVVINGVEQSDEPRRPLPWDACGVEPVVAAYNGQPTNATVKVDLPTEDTLIIRYTTDTTDPKTWSEEMPTFTDAGEYYVGYVIEDRDGNYVPVTNYTYVTITKLGLTIQADSDMKVFDGTPLKLLSGTVVSGTFLEGEMVTDFSMTEDSTITAVGSVPNRIDRESFVWDPAGAGKNYEIVLLDGTLTVVPAATPEEAVEEDDPYPFDPEDPKAPVPPVDESGEPITLSRYDFVGPYDGTGHTLDTNALLQAISEGEWLGCASNVTYSVDGENWVTDPSVFTNVVATSFWYKVSAPNFSNYVHAVAVVVTQRVASVTAADAAWVYDGAEHGTNAFTTAGFVAGEGVESLSMTSDSVVKDLDAVHDNTIDESSVVFKDGTDPANYSITFVKGTLRIASSEIAGLWITDHADGGPGKVHLAFALSRLNESEVSAEYVNALFAAGRIKVAWGATEEDLAKAEPVVATPRADAAGAFQSETGWVWITVTLPEETSYPLLYKVLVTD